MTHPNNGSPGQRRGFLASLSQAFTPKPVPEPEEDTGPLVAPKGVLAATALSIVAGLAYLLWGIVLFWQIDSLMSSAKDDYSTHLRDCTSEFGGIGTTAITASSPTGSAQTCQQMQVLGPSDWDTIKTMNLVWAAVFVVMGLALVAAGWFLKSGRTWARRTLVTVTIITLLEAFLLGLTSTLIMAATLLMLLAVVLCYVSSGATYFNRVKARKHT